MRPMLRLKWLETEGMSRSPGCRGMWRRVRTVRAMRRAAASAALVMEDVQHACQLCCTRLHTSPRYLCSLFPLLPYYDNVSNVGSVHVLLSAMLCDVSTTSNRAVVHLGGIEEARSLPKHVLPPLRADERESYLLSNNRRNEVNCATNARWFRYLAVVRPSHATHVRVVQLASISGLNVTF